MIAANRKVRINLPALATPVELISAELIANQFPREIATVVPSRYHDEGITSRIIRSSAKFQRSEMKAGNGLGTARIDVPVTKRVEITGISWRQTDADFELMFEAAKPDEIVADIVAAADRAGELVEIEIDQDSAVIQGEKYQIPFESDPRLNELLEIYKGYYSGDAYSTRHLALPLKEEEVEMISKFWEGDTERQLELAAYSDLETLASLILFLPWINHIPVSDVTELRAKAGQRVLSVRRSDVLEKPGLDEDSALYTRKYPAFLINFYQI